MNKYTEYTYPADWVSNEVKSKQANVKANVGQDTDLLKFGLGIIAKRLKKDPLRYRDYGVYWWAIKALLRNINVSYGSNDDAIMREFYKGKKPVETLVMAEAFRDEYLATNIIYTNEFVLDADNGDITVIVDGDMENI